MSPGPKNGRPADTQGGVRLLGRRFGRAQQAAILACFLALSAGAAAAEALTKSLAMPLWANLAAVALFVLLVRGALLRFSRPAPGRRGPAADPSRAPKPPRGGPGGEDGGLSGAPRARNLGDEAPRGRRP